MIESSDAIDPIACTHHAEHAARFHGEHAWVMDELIRLAREFVTRGRRLSINALFEAIRLRSFFLADVRETPKLNNNFRAWYAREIMRRCPDLAGRFETRRIGREDLSHYAAASRGSE